MKHGEITSADSETPVYFSVGQDKALGILTRPAGTPIGTVAVALGAGSAVSSLGPNRFLVRLCRRVGDLGYDAFRFDYHGVGESTGSVGSFRLDEPFIDDLDAALAWLHARGMRDVLLIGWCFGARTALARAPNLSNLSGLVLVSPPVADTLEPDDQIWRMASNLRAADMLKMGIRPWVVRSILDRDRRKRYAKLLAAKLRLVAHTRREHRAPTSHSTGSGHVSPHFLHPLRELIDRGVPVLFIYGSADGYYDDFQRAMQVIHRDRDDDARPPPVAVATVSGPLHHVPSVAAQESVLNIIEEWISSERRAADMSAVPRSLDTLSPREQLPIGDALPGKRIIRD